MLRVADVSKVGTDAYLQYDLNHHFKNKR